MRSYTCRICGRIVNLNSYNDESDKSRMGRESICYECMYWHALLTHPLPYSYIINHQYVTFPPVVKPERPVRYILTKKGKLHCSTELFNYGTIPQQFREDYPDTASFLPYHRLRTLQAHEGFECDRKGCWDRKNCIWYKGEMDWNEIPDSHRPGDECCPMFINVLKP